MADSSPDLDLLTSLDGQPVWPLGSDAGKEAIQAIASVFESELIRVKAEKRETHPPPDAECVVGIGNVESEARLYAHLTKRRWMMVDRAGLISAHRSAAVVVCRGPVVDIDLIDQLLTSHALGRVIGVIWGRNRSELRERVLVASCAASLNTPPDGEAITQVVGPRMHTRENPSTLGELKSVLGKGAGALVLHGHGDGMSIELPAKTMLCSRAGNSEDGDSARAPECVYSAKCRLGVSVETAKEEGRLFAPEDLAARIVISSACQLLFVGNDALASAWSSFPRMAINPRIGALVVSPEVFCLMPAVMDRHLIKGLKRGEAIGKALTQYHNDGHVKAHGGRLLLFGDPQVRATSITAPPRLIASETTQGPSQSSERSFGSHEVAILDGKGTDSQLELFRLITRVSREETRAEARTTTSALLREVMRYSTAESETIREEAEAGLRKAALNHLALVKARVSEAWLPALREAKPGSSSRCPNCGLPGRGMVMHLLLGATREVFKCLACGEVFDYQVDGGRRPVIDLPNVALGGSSNGEAWDGAVYVSRAKISDTIMIPWPSTPNGEPNLYFSIADKLTVQAPLRVCAVFIEGLALNARGVVSSGASEFPQQAPLTTSDSHR